jgi:DNA-dependent protein kinase catalytic subunit
LNGENPAYITVSELKESVHAPQVCFHLTETQITQEYFKNLQRIVLGDAKDNIRANVKEKCSSPKEQVDCLVDQATDPNILGRTYFGWAPWV